MSSYFDGVIITPIPGQEGRIKYKVSYEDDSDINPFVLKQAFWDEGGYMLTDKHLDNLPKEALELLVYDIDRSKDFELEIHEGNPITDLKDMQHEFPIKMFNVIIEVNEDNKTFWKKFGEVHLVQYGKLPENYTGKYAIEIPKDIEYLHAIHEYKYSEVERVLNTLNKDLQLAIKSNTVDNRVLSEFKHYLETCKQEFSNDPFYQKLQSHVQDLEIEEPIDEQYVEELQDQVDALRLLIGKMDKNDILYWTLG